MVSSDWVRLHYDMALLVVRRHCEVARARHHKILEAPDPTAVRCQRHLLRQASDGERGRQPEACLHLVRRIPPAVFGFEEEPERLTHAAHGR